MKIDALRKRYVAPIPSPSTPVQPVKDRDVAFIEGTQVEIAGGRSFVREIGYPGNHAHGLHRLGELSALAGRAAATLTGDPELAYVELPRAVFLDTETTGLGLGAGTYVFLVGAGYSDGASFQVRQFFLGSLSEERAFLEEVARFLSEFPAVVTFNGKAFDWPLLESRFAFHRRRAPLDDPPHLDLLHPARRLWRRRLESCALGALEREIFGVMRTAEDVPGWQIPSLYFEYLRNGNGSLLGGVFYHNLHDVLSLAALAVHLHRVIQDPMSGLVADPVDFLSLARIFERMGELRRSIDCYEEALSRGISGVWREACLLGLGGAYKRQRAWDRALAIWERLIDAGGSGGLLGFVETAKYYEHVERDYLQALDAVQGAITLMELEPQVMTRVDRGELEHRRARLLNRIYRHRSWVASGN